MRGHFEDKYETGLGNRKGLISASIFRLVQVQIEKAGMYFIEPLNPRSLHT